MMNGMALIEDAVYLNKSWYFKGNFSERNLFPPVGQMREFSLHPHVARSRHETVQIQINIQIYPTGPTQACRHTAVLVSVRVLITSNK